VTTVVLNGHLTADDVAAVVAGARVALDHVAVRRVAVQYARVAPLTEDRPPPPDVAALRPLAADSTSAAPVGEAAAGANGVGAAPTPAGAAPR
jgi:hypothetical protein